MIGLSLISVIASATDGDEGKDESEFVLALLFVRRLKYAYRSEKEMQISESRTIGLWM